MGKISQYRRSEFNGTSDMSAIQRAGADAKAISQGAGQLFDVSMAHKEAQDRSFVSNQMIELEKRAREKFDVWKTNNADNPLDKGPELEELIRGEINSLSEKAPSGAASNSLRDASNSIISRMNAQGDTWAKEQNVKNIADQLDDSANTLALRTHREGFAALDEVNSKIDDIAFQNSLALPKEYREEATKKYRMQNTLNAFENVIKEGNLSDAQTRLNSKAHDSDLGADGVKSVQRMIDRRREELKNANKKKAQLKVSDTWRYVQKETGFNPETINVMALTPEQMSQRTAEKDRYDRGLTLKLPYFTNREAEVFLNQAVDMDSNSLLGVMQNMNESMNPDQVRSFVTQIGHIDSKHNQLANNMMTAFSAVGEEPALAKEILEGSKAIHNKTVDVEKINAVRDTFNEVYAADTFLDPQAQAQAISASQAIFASRLAKGSDADVEEAVKSLLGEPMEINGHKIPPPRDPDTGRFLEDVDDSIDDLSTEDLLKIQGDTPLDRNGNPYDVEELLGRGKLYKVNEQEYILKLGSGVITGKNGKPYRFNLPKIHKYMKKNKKGWFN